MDNLESTQQESAETQPIEQEAEIVEETGEKKSKKQKKRFRDRPHWKATLIVIGVVIVAAGAGFWVWHNTPSFCDAICHDPQDPYNPTYYAELGESATDKWGNEVEDASGMYAAVHREAGLVCMDCHVPSIEEQVTEGFRWLSGNFYSPLSERSLENLVAYRNVAAEEFCLNESCHNYTKSDLTEVTSSYSRNPHAWHHSEYTCTDCHKSHRASIMVCAECHEDSTLPAGWITPQDARELTTIYGAYDDEENDEE